MVKRGESVLLIDKRDHIGGNCYDYFDEKNNYIQKYGPHIFHTHSKKIWDYFSEFTEWKEYNHEVLANINDKLLPIPFNFHTIDKIYKTKEAQLQYYTIIIVML